MPVGLVLGIIALVKINQSQGQLQGKGLAIAAIVISGLSVPIMGILAAIAVPSFQSYQNKAKSAEGRMMLMQLVSAQEASFLEFDRYVAGRTVHAKPGTLAAFEQAPCDPACKNGQPEACTSLACVGFEGAGQVFYQYACEVSPDAQRFTCAAYADLDGDGEPGIFIYGSGEGPLGAPVPEFEIDNPACAKVMAGELVPCTPRRL